MEPAVVTFRPDNFLTIGLIIGIVYLAGVLLAQGLMRAGLIAPVGGPNPATPVQVVV